MYWYIDCVSLQAFWIHKSMCWFSTTTQYTVLTCKDMIAVTLLLLLTFVHYLAMCVPGDLFKFLAMLAKFSCKGHTIVVKFCLFTIPHSMHSQGEPLFYNQGRAVQHLISLNHHLLYMNTSFNMASAYNLKYCVWY